MPFFILAIMVCLCAILEDVAQLFLIKEHFVECRGIEKFSPLILKATTKDAFDNNNCWVTGNEKETRKGKVRRK